jgi:beta-galactosidase
LAKSRIWAEKGFRTAAAQIGITVARAYARPTEKTFTPVKFETRGECTVLEGDNFAYTFNNFYGSFESIAYNGAELLHGRPKLGVWRAPTDNDRYIKQKWMEENLHHVTGKVYSVDTEKDGDGVLIKVEGSLGAPARQPFAKTLVTYTVLPCGEIRVKIDADIREKMIFLPRFGMEFVMPEGSEHLEYFGLGPDENYSDMNRHVFMGRYKSSVSEQYFPYIKPQEHGNHGRVKWAGVYNAFGRGLLFKAEHDFNFSASHYTAEDLAAATHTNELSPRGETFIRIDHKNGGIGSGSCGPYTFEKYQLTDKKIAYSFSITPFCTEEMPPGETRL